MQTLKSNLDLFHSFLLDMRSTSSNNVKLSLLKQYHKTDSKDFFEKVFHYTYNPFFKYYVHSNNLKKNSELTLDQNNYSGLFELLDDLRERRITGHTAIASINSFTNELEDHQKEIVHLILNRDLQMRASTSSINKVFKDCIPTFSVALAGVYKPSLVDFENEVWYGSRKLDGVRCLAIKENDNVTFLSRSGKEFETLDRVKQDILDIPGNFILDGEICMVDENGKEDFQGIIKQIRRKNHTIENPKFLVFDCLTIDEFNTRKGIKWLNERLVRTPMGNISTNLYQTLEKVEHVHIHNEEQFTEMVANAESEGYEGIMVRRNVPYEGIRSNNLLKVKKFHDEEYTVKEVIQGPQRFVENGKEIWKEVMRNIIIEHKGCNVSVGSGFSKEQREYYHENPTELIGKTVTIQYFEETYNQAGGTSLRFPVVKHIYDNGRDC